jgi:phage protein D
LPGVSFTLLIAMAPALPTIVDAVQEIEIESSLDVASMVRVRLGIAQTTIGDWTTLQYDLFRPLVPLGVRIQVGTGVPEAIINAFVSAQQVNYADRAGESTLDVYGMDKTLLMNMQDKVMLWPSMPDSAIAATVFGQYAIAPQIQPTTPVLIEPEGTTTQRGSDIRFLRRLAARNGFDCFVQPEPLTGIDFGYFKPPSLFGLPQAVINVNMGPETNVSEFKIRYDMLKPTTALAATIDATTKSPQPALAPLSLEMPLGIEPALTRILPPPIARPTNLGLTRSANLQTAVQAIVDRSSWAVIAEGKVGADVGILRPGKIINIRGAGRVFNGSYYCTRVAHTLTRTDYVQRFEARRNAVDMTGAELYVEL